MLHVVPPAKNVKVPAVQVVHEVAAMFSCAVPVGHAVHTAAPSSAKVPALQLEQSALLEAPRELFAVPAGQREQAEAPAVVP